MGRVNREFGCSADAGYNRSVPTDPGLGPSSQKPAAPPEGGAERPKQVDSVEAVLEGFGKDRPDRPRIKPAPESTPLPDKVGPVKPPGASTTHPAMRKVESRRKVFFAALTAVCILVVAFVAWKAREPAAPQPVSTTTSATLPPPPATTAEPQVQPIPVENLAPAAAAATAPTVGGTAVGAATARPVATAASAKPALTLPPPVPTTTAPAGPDPKNDVKRTM